MIRRILKWVAYTILAIIIAVSAFLLYWLILIPLFSQAIYAGDGEYKTTTGVFGTFILELPEFSLDEEATYTFKLDRFSMPYGARFGLKMKNAEPVPFALLDTVVSVTVSDKEGNVIHAIDAPLNGHNAHCAPHTEADTRARQKRNVPVWYGAHCRDITTDAVYKTDAYFWQMGGERDTTFSWLNNYTVSISVKNIDPDYSGSTAFLRISTGGK